MAALLAAFPRALSLSAAANAVLTAPSGEGDTHLSAGVTSRMARARLASATTGPASVSQWAATGGNRSGQQGSPKRGGHRNPPNRGGSNHSELLQRGPIAGGNVASPSRTLVPAYGVRWFG